MPVNDRDLLMLGELRGTLERVERLLSEHSRILLGDGEAREGLASRVRALEEFVNARVTGTAAAGGEVVLTRSDVSALASFAGKAWPVLKVAGALLAASGIGAWLRGLLR